MEKELTKYVNQSKYMGTGYNFEKKLIFETEMKTVPLTEAESNAYLGDLLYHTREYEDAEKYLQKALALDGNSVMANTSYGLVRMRQRKFADAKSFLEKAIAGDAKNHYAQYNYAYVLSREDMDESGYIMGYSPEKADLMRRALQKTIQLKPDFSESYRLLAFVNLVNNENLDESLVLLKKGLAYQPGNQEYALLEAQIFLRQEKFAEARSIAEKLAKTAEEQYMKANAENILRSINQYENAKNNYQKQVDEINSNNASVSAPTLTRRSAMSEAEREKLEAERSIDSMNRAVKKPENGQKQILGYLEKITCPNGTVAYSVKTETETISLTSKDFQSLYLVSLSPESQDYQVGCDADLKNARAVITYRPAATAKSKSKGEITEIYFVSKNFRFKSEAEMAESDAKQEVLTQDDIKDQIEASIKNSLRKPEAGERRELTTPDKIECSGKLIFFVVKSGDKVLKLKTDSPQNVGITAFTQNVGQMKFGCGVKLPSVPAIVTYRPSPDPDDKISGEIVALEFVPEGFKLD